LPSQSVSS